VGDPSGLLWNDGIRSEFVILGLWAWSGGLWVLLQAYSGLSGGAPKLLVNPLLAQLIFSDKPKRKGKGLILVRGRPGKARWSLGIQWSQNGFESTWKRKNTTQASLTPKYKTQNDPRSRMLCTLMWCPMWKNSTLYLMMGLSQNSSVLKCCIKLSSVCVCVCVCVWNIN
jgi:hypothetical protein